eukprot:6482237-Amphidinium_carterae.3
MHGALLCAPELCVMVQKKPSARGAATAAKKRPAKAMWGKGRTLCHVSKWEGFQRRSLLSGESGLQESLSLKHRELEHVKWLVKLLGFSCPQANKKCGQEKRDALAKLVNDAMIPDDKGVYVCDGECAFAKEILTQSSRAYKKPSSRAWVALERRGNVGGQNYLRMQNKQRNP